MKFRFPIVIIDEDWRADSASGLGIRALAKAIEDQGTEVVGGFTYYDVAMVANQARPVVLVDPFQFRFPGVGIRHETRRRAVLELLFRP